MRALLVILFCSSTAAATELTILTRDGTLVWLDGEKEIARSVGFVHPQGLAPHGPSEVAVLAGDRITLVAHGKRGRTLRGKYRLLAGDRRLIAIDTAGLVCELRGDRCKKLGDATGAHLLAVDDNAVLIEKRGIVEELGSDRRYPITGHPIALGASAGKIYVATKEGPLWIIDRMSGAQHDLGLGGWWGTLDLVAFGDTLFVVTQAGKLWEIRPAIPEKRALALSGWEAAYAITVVR